MSIYQNAIDSIYMGIEDFKSNDSRRVVSCVRNLQAGILLLFKHKLVQMSPPESDAVRETPFHRVLLSGEILTPKARRFALQWGIIVIEPDRLPLLTLHELAGRLVPSIRTMNSSIPDEVWEEVPRLLLPLQAKMGDLSKMSSQSARAMRQFQEDRALDFLQRVVGDQYWMALDISDPHWLERRFEALNRVLGLDQEPTRPLIKRAASRNPRMRDYQHHIAQSSR